MYYLTTKAAALALCNDPAVYQISSAIFYEQWVDEFEILTHFKKYFKRKVVFGGDNDYGSEEFKEGIKTTPSSPTGRCPV
ncbi:MAG: hypothetical protein ABIN01_10245 [Ferruginibacter sp.]